MMTNELLREKYCVQKAMDEKANHNLAQYVANTHARIKEIEAKYGVKFKYGKPALSLPEVRVGCAEERNPCRMRSW